MNRLCIHLLGRFERREEEAKRLRKRAADHGGYPPCKGAIVIGHLASIHHRSAQRLSVDEVEQPDGGH
jgi:hypothetical protein